MKTSQYLALVRQAGDYSVPVQYDITAQTVTFTVDIDVLPKPGKVYEYVVSTDIIRDWFSFGDTAEDIVVRVIDFTTDRYCARCERVDDSEELVPVCDEKICRDCLEDMVFDAQYDATLDSMRGRDI